MLNITHKSPYIYLLINYRDHIYGSTIIKKTNNFSPNKAARSSLGWLSMAPVSPGATFFCFVIFDDMVTGWLTIRDSVSSGFSATFIVLAMRGLDRSRQWGIRAGSFTKPFLSSMWTMLFIILCWPLKTWRQKRPTLSITNSVTSFHSRCQQQILINKKLCYHKEDSASVMLSWFTSLSALFSATYGLDIPDFSNWCFSRAHRSSIGHISAFW